MNMGSKYVQRCEDNILLAAYFSLWLPVILMIVIMTKNTENCPSQVPKTQQCLPIACFCPALFKTVLDIFLIII